MIAADRPDVIGATAITPSIYKAERLLRIAKEVHPQAVTVLGSPCTTVVETAVTQYLSITHNQCTIYDLLNITQDM